jgi:aspartate-semialdehyde dehydrogenase
MSRKYAVGILGATGTVGQRFIQLLENHPQFEITALAASDRSAGKPFAEACAWKLAGGMPGSVKQIMVQPIEPSLDCEIVFSSLPSSVARETELAFARAGYAVISNSSSYRMDEDVPLLIPEINAEHLGLIEIQQQKRGLGKGFIITNPNARNDDARRRNRGDSKLPDARSSFVASEIYGFLRRAFAPAAASRPRRRKRDDNHGRATFP